MHFQKIPGRKAPIIAIVGSDGSGKTTVSQEILHFMSDYRPTRLCHLGKQTGNLRRAMRQRSPLGEKVDERIRKVSVSARQNGISFPVALVMFIASMRRVVRFAKMAIFHLRGRAILTDRYPQVAVSETMDGPLLHGRELTDAGARTLMYLEFWLYQQMARLKPDVVLRLNVDLATAIQRKPDHRPEALEKKIRAVPLLTFNGAPIVELDAGAPLETVLAQAMATVKTVMDSYPPAPRP